MQLLEYKGCGLWRQKYVRLTRGSSIILLTNESLQSTWASNWSPGEKSLVTVSLKDVEGGTEITILHENFNTEASRDGHNQGWAGCLEELAAMLEG